ncbi:MAG: hypothetical protein LWY06_17265 [Firmicutes bacterium]|nr:hypothetical protein [Bacillota bacterium]
MNKELDLTYMSAPADANNPGFESLLSAMKAVHQGEADISLLQVYHDALTEQINDSRNEILDMEVSETTKDTKNMSLGAINIVSFMLDSIKIYLDSPSPENMGICVNAYLDARGAVEYVHKVLDANIEEAGIEEEEEEEEN